MMEKVRVGKITIDSTGKVSNSDAAQPVLTRAEKTTLNNDGLLVWESANNRAVTKTLSALGIVPTSRTINDKSLLSDITLTASDVGARPTGNIPWVEISGKPDFAPADAQKNSDITKAEIEAKLVGEITSHNHALPTHNHDDTYYTETEVDTQLAGKANTSHNHDASDINTGTLGVDRIPSLPQSKITNLSNYLNNKVSYGETIMNTNPFGGKKLYINSINNAIFNADLRWTVTAKRYRKSDNVFIADLPTHTLFDGDYDGYTVVPKGEYLVVNIKFFK